MIRDEGTPMAPEKAKAVLGEEKPEETHTPARRKASVSVVDRRRVGRAEEGKGPAAEPNLKPTYVEELEARVQRAEARLRERLAELEEEARKSRARVEKDLEKRFADRERALLLDLLGIFDDLERASSLAAGEAAVAEGLRLVGARIARFLESRGLSRFAPAAGEDFDPRTMEAVALQPGPQGRVASLLQPGYTLEGEILRPARVAVGSGAEEGAERESPEAVGMET